MATHRHRWRQRRRAAGEVVRALCARWYLVVLALAPTYVWALLHTPEFLLWSVAAAAGVAAGAAAARWPRSVLWWLPPCVLLFNTPAHWLPWPYVKLACIVPAAACTALICRRPGRVYQRAGLHGSVLWVLGCLAASVILGVLANLLWHEPATWHELRRALRMVPLLDDRDMFVSLRYGWVWLLGVAAFAVVAVVITAPRDLRALVVSLHVCALPMAAFALYSYVTGTYMVSYYVYERRVNATCSSPAVLADIITVIAVLGLQQLLRARRWYERVLLCGALALEITVIVLTGCRLNLVLLTLFVMLGGVAWLMWAVHTRPRLAFKALCVATVAAMALGGVAAWHWPRVQQLPVVRRLQEWKIAVRTEQYRGLLFPGRIDHWECALRMARAAPLWGMGAGQFEANYLQYRTGKDMFDYARAHNAYLRTAAEGGLLTLAALLAALGWAGTRMVRFWNPAVRAAAPEWAWYGRAFSLGLLMVAASALSSDVAVENVEMVVFWALLAGVVRACDAGCSRALARPPGMLAAYLARLERRTQRVVAHWGWERLAHVRLQTWMGVVCAVLLCALFIMGTGAAQARAVERAARGRVYYGFTYLERSGPGNARWYTIPTHALALLAGGQPLMLLRYRALNERMAQRDQLLTVRANGVFLAGVKLNSTVERTLYCDISALSDAPLAVSFEVPRAFVPWREGWGLLHRPCAAVVTYPQLIAQEPSNVYGSAGAAWSTNASAYAEFYEQAGAARAAP